MGLSGKSPESTYPVSVPGQAMAWGQLQIRGSSYIGRGSSIGRSRGLGKLSKSIYFVARRDPHMMRSIIDATGCALLLAAWFGGCASTPDPGPLQGESSAAVGATFPYVEQEAENAATNGTILSSRVWRT